MAPGSLFLSLMLALSLSQDPELADQVSPAEDSPAAGRVTAELVKLWRKQADQGDAQAQTNLGLLYSTGDGVPHDPGMAVEWFRKAAEQGDGLGQLMLATKYFEGAGVARDPVKGTAWAILAAEKFYSGIYGVIDGGTGRTITFPNSPESTQDLTLAEVKQAQQLATELRQKIGARSSVDLSTLFLGLPPGSRFIVPFQSTGDKGQKTSPEAPGGVNFGTIEFVSKPGPEPSPPFKVGIVQANGNLVPLVTFDGEDWSRVDLAEDWRSGRRVQSTGEWTLWYESSDPGSPQLFPASIEIATTGLIATEPRCNYGDRIFALATDAGDLRESLVTCKNCCPEPKRGIATTSKSPPDRVARLDPENEDDRRVAAQILDIFNELENKEFERTRHEYDDKTGKFISTGKTIAEHVDPRLSSEKRIRLPFAFDDTIRVEGINTTYYYIEVTRGYYEQLKEEFPYAAFLQGWVRATADELVWMTQRFELTEMEQKDISYDTPILFWGHGDVVDVLFERSQWGSGYYGILRIDNDTVNELIRVGFR